MIKAEVNERQMLNNTSTIDCALGYPYSSGQGHIYQTGDKNPTQSLSGAVHMFLTFYYTPIDKL